MKWYAQGVVVGMAVMMPAAGFCFPGNMKQPQESAPSQQSSPAAAPAKEEAVAPKPYDGPTHAGKVLETMDGGGYTYLRLEKKNGEKHWFAVPAVATIKVGQELELMMGTEMGQFTSKALNRKFDSINFSSGIVVREDPEAIKKQAHAGVAGDVKGKEGEVIKVDKAAGPDAYTIEEVHQKKSDLVGKNVVVRGKVVKISSGILDRNWIHLRDGSGSAANGSNDLLVTSQEAPAVGDIVTFTGDFFRDKSFGNGYNYDVIIENAKIKK